MQDNKKCHEKRQHLNTGLGEVLLFLSQFPAFYFLIETVTNSTTYMKVRITSYKGLSKPTGIKIYFQKYLS